MNIALFGTFDVENYGDLLFPTVFEKEMRKRLPDMSLFLFSPTANGGKKALEPETPLYAAKELPELHKKHHFDAIVIGGGALIHFNEIAVKMQNQEATSVYRNLDSWFYPLVFAIRNQIRVFFNAPQVPYAIPLQLSDLFTEVMGQVEYISLRDHVSADFFAAACKDAEISSRALVVPDTVCCLKENYSEKDLQVLRNKITPELSDSKYAILQFNPAILPEELKKMPEVVQALRNLGLDVYLLPIGYTHRDEMALKALHNYCPNSCKIINEKFSIIEMASILAGCDVYVGASFHGAITAIAYGKTAVSYNFFEPKAKNREIFAMYGVGDFVAEDVSGICKILKGLKDGTLSFTPKRDAVVNDVNAHFDRLAERIKGEKSVKTPNEISWEKWVDLAQSMSRANQELAAKSDYDALRDRMVAAETNLHKAHLQLAESAGKQQELSALLKESQNVIACQQAVLSECQTTLANIADSQVWKMTKPLRLLLDFAKKIPLFRAMHKCLKSLRQVGLKATLHKAKKKLFPKKKKEQPISKAEFDAQKTAKFDVMPTYSILVPLFNTPEKFLREMIDSVQKQTYAKWELCLCDGSDGEHSDVGKIVSELQEGDSRIKYRKLEKNLGISGNSNACAEMATGDYIGLFDHDDLLHPSALYFVTKEVNEKQADFIYTDESTFKNHPSDAYFPHYKPDFSPDTLRSYNYICHFSVFKTDLFREVGGFRSKCDGSQDYDLVLRLTEKARHIVHIPRILYYWRAHGGSVATDIGAKPYVIEAAHKALSDHLERVGLAGKVEDSSVISTYRIRYEIQGEPKISIVIPNKDNAGDLDKCLKSVLGKTTYRNYEVIIVENNSTDPNTFLYYASLQDNPKVKVVTWEPKVREFNYSAINNYGAQFATGEYLLLLNNDIEIITPDWLQEMLMFCQRRDVGAAGMMLYYPDDTVQHAGVILGIGGVAGHSHKYLPKGIPGYASRMSLAQNLSAVTAAAMMVKKSVFDEVHGLNEEFKVAFNDIDLCMRIRKAGYLIVFTPYAEAYHYESKSRGAENTPEKIARFNGEVARFHSYWDKELEAGDPYYNPNLTLEREDFSY